MKRLCCLSLALLFLSGCWRGGLLPKNRIAYRHDAVIWVYKTGGQVGRYGILPMPCRNELLDLQAGDGCVYVKEGQTGGQCSAAPQANLQLSHTLDLRTGRPVLGRGPTKRIDHPEPIARADLRSWERPIRRGRWVRSLHGCLYLRAPAEILVLQVKHADPELTWVPSLGNPMAEFRVADDLLVVGLSEGYVVCIDLKKVPIGSRARTP